MLNRDMENSKDCVGKLIVHHRYLKQLKNTEICVNGPTGNERRTIEKRTS